MTYNGNDALTIHPPAAELSTWSYSLVSWHTQQLSNMTSAGIDVALPVYWGDDQSVATWSQAGLRNMVTAEQAMIQAGQSPPKIGMFHDVSSTQIKNNNVPPDVTTTAGKALLYQQIHDFFSIVPRNLWATIDGKPIVVFYLSQYVSRYNQSTFDYIVRQFQLDFGATPYLILERSWQGVSSDAAYQWGAALDHAYFTGDVAEIGPGFNETNRSKYVPGYLGVPRIRDRDCGLFYQDAWDEIDSSSTRLVMIETWDELIESTGICDTQEYGRQYITISADRIKRWKARAPYAIPPVLQMNFGRDSFASALHPIFTNLSDGVWISSFVAGHEAAITARTNNPPAFYIYLGVDNAFLHGATTPLWVTVEYLDTGTASWWLDYDGAGGPYIQSERVYMANTGTWRTHIFFLPDAQFTGRENGGAALRIDDYNPSGESHYFSRVWISKTAPTGTAARITPVADVVLGPGTSVDVPLEAATADGSPVTFALVRGPAFASLQSKDGASFVHIAPAPSDAQACPSVVTVVASNNTGSVFADAVTFRILVTAAPTLELSVPALAFTVAQGSGVTQSISLSSSAAAAFNWSVSTSTQSGSNWLQVSPASGTAGRSATVDVTANAAGLGIGTYIGVVKVSAPTLGNGVQSVPVTLTITTPGALSVGSRSLTFNAAAGSDPPAQALSISNSGPVGTTVNWTAIVSAVGDGNWLSVTPSSGTNNGSAQVVVHASSLTPGQYTGTITISSPGAQNSPINVLVTLNVTQPPVVQAVYDSWNYIPGLAPGAWVTIAGTGLASGSPQTWNLDGVQQLPITLGGVTVSFNGTPAALFYVSAAQINALVPAGIVPGPVQVVVQVNGIKSNAFSVNAAATLPAIYALPSADGATFFVTAALAGTSVLVGNSAVDPRVIRAAQPGDVLDLYLIGLGATADPAQFVTDRVFLGAFPISAQISATVGGQTAQVVFAGLTSPGLYLTRIIVPTDLPPGPQPIQISTGGAQTRPSLVLLLGSTTN